jgi:DNA processing protein
LSEGILHFKPGDELRELNGWERKALVLSQFEPFTRWKASNAMARNKLICALARAVIIVESGPERNEEGKMSGTFNTGMTALQMDIPLFVVNYSLPQAHLPIVSNIDVPFTPEGNRVLIEKGGKPLLLSPDNLEQSIQRAVKSILQEVSAREI